MTTTPPHPRDEDERSGAPDAAATGRVGQEAANAAEGTGDRRRSRFGRKGGGTPAPDEPDGWRTGPAWQEMRRAERGPGRDRIRNLLIVAATVVVALVAINPSGTRALLTGGKDASDGSPVTSGGEATTPGTPVATDPDTPTVSRPFAGSPALHWADGVAGIVVPPARPVSSLTERQVAAVLRTTKAYLVDTNLDPAELRGGYPDAALRLVDPINEAQAQMKQSLRSPSAKTDPSSWFTRYDPAHFTLVGTVVKVRGGMTLAKADHGAVRVHTDYTYVYAFTKVGDRTGDVERVIVRRVADTQWYPGSPAGEVQVVASYASFGGSACGIHDGYMHPFVLTTPGSADATGPATDPYDRSGSLDTAGGCGSATRT